jgi:CubicO group peptidase (beta-lactamase class C family)
MVQTSADHDGRRTVGEPAEDAPFLTLIHQLILKPLGMSGTKARPATEPATAYAPGWGPDPQVRYGLHVMAPRNLFCYAGSMAFFSTPSELVRFGLAINGGTLLQPATVRSLRTSQQLTSGQETGYGLGWDLHTVTLAGESTQAVSLDGGWERRWVVDDVSRSRDRGGRDVEHLARGYAGSGAESRGSVRAGGA